MSESFLGVFVSTCLVGAAIKLMDDRLDAPQDRAIGKVNWSDELGRADLPYALLLFTLAAISSLDTAVALFVAAYTVGMGGSPGRISPFGLPYWLEGALAVICGLIAVGLQLQLAGLLAAAAVQLFDNVRDRREDQRLNSGSQLLRTTEQLLAGMLLTILGLLLRPALVSSTLFAYLLHEILQATFRRRESHGADSVKR